MIDSNILRLINSLSDIFIICDREGEVLAYNQAAERQFAITIAQGTPANISKFFSNTDSEIRDALKICSRTTKPTQLSLKFDDSVSTLSMRCSGARFVLSTADDQGEILISLHCVKRSGAPERFSILNKELRQNRRTLVKLIESKRQTELEHERSMITLESIADAVIATNEHGFIEVFNEAAELLTQTSADTVLGSHISEIIQIISGPYDTAVRTPLEICLHEKKRVVIENAKALIQPSQVTHIISASASPIRLHTGAIMGAVMVFRDISEAHETQQKMKFLAEHDLLTGIANRHTFNASIEQAIINTSVKKPCSLLFFDLDQFKVVNDAAGHQAGDRLLKEITELIMTRLRASDLLARVGGDEFTLLLPNTNLENAEAVASQIIQLIKRYVFRYQDYAFDVTLSVGVSEVSDPDTLPSEVIRQADVACYIAKKSGGNQYHCYIENDSKERANLNEYNLLSEIRKALDKDSFTLKFQSLINIRTGESDFQEVLVRMQDSRGQTVPPADFIPIAERSGLMREVDLWVVTNALKTVHKLALEGKTLRLSINLSGRSIGSKELLTQLETLISKYKIPNDTIIFEITETSAIENIDTAQEFIQNIRALGCLFALDDFGAGFSSFRYLKNLPVEYVKIDGSFITNILNDSSDEAMVRAIHQIAHSLGKKTVAEFVASQAVINLLAEIGIDYAQGFFYGQPCDIEELTNSKNLALQET